MGRAFRTLLTAVAIGNSAAQAQKPGSSSLWHPVPQAALQALSSDRPGNGENPFTLDAGHYQFELGALGYTHVGAHDPGAASIGAGQVKLRTGLAPGVELQLLFDGYKWQRGGEGDWSGAAGGVSTRVKVNAWGNHGGTTAFALMPSAGLARDGAGRWLANGGLVATLAVHGPAGWSIALTGNGAIAAQHAGPAVASGGAVLGLSHVVSGPVAFAMEATALRADLSARATEFRGGAALIAGVSSSFQVDAGLDLGFTHGAEAVRSYFGLVRRF